MLDSGFTSDTMVVTSQNLTQENRPESAFITTDKEIFAMQPSR